MYREQHGGLKLGRGLGAQAAPAVRYKQEGHACWHGGGGWTERAYVAGGSAIASARLAVDVPAAKAALIWHWRLPCSMLRDQLGVK